MLFQELTTTAVLSLLAILGGSVVLAWLAFIFLVRIIQQFTKKTETRLDDVIASALRVPIVAIILFAGVYFASLPFPLQPDTRLYISRGSGVILSLLGIYTGVTLINTLAGWYRKEVKARAGISAPLLRLVQWTAVLAGGLAGLVIVLDILGIEAVALKNWVGQFGWKIALIFILSNLAILLAGRVIPRLVAAGTERRSDETEEGMLKRVNTLSRVLVNAGQIILLLIAGFMILSTLDIDVGPILAGAGVIGIAIGFGAQSLIRDLIAGVFIIMENQYRVGDVARIADVGGLVEDINLRRTVLRDLDGIVHVIPNGEIRVSSNFTKLWSRVNLNVSVAYKENLDHVISVINRVGKELAEDPVWAPDIIKAPQVLRVDSLGESGIDIKILGDTKPIRQWDVMGELRKRLKKAFDEEGIEIPWPHTKVYFGSSPFDSNPAPQ